ncbi:hypothetical protein Ancab_002600 [Ancistrocladus abbreviatus]
MARRWGKFISLDDSTSKKERFDIGRMLIATDLPGFITKAAQLSMDNKAFSIRVNEEMLGANLFKHMAIFNVDGHGDNPGVLASDKGVPSSPSASSSQAHNVESEIQSVTPAPTSSK